VLRLSSLLLSWPVAAAAAAVAAAVAAAAPAQEAS